MKKLLYSVFALLALSCTFVACSDDDAPEGAPVSQTPAADCAGTYNGTWTIDSTYASQTTTGSGSNKRITGDTLVGSVSVPGTATIAPNDTSAYTAGLSFFVNNYLNCSTKVNVFALSGKYGFENSDKTGANGLGTTFGGKNTVGTAFSGTISDGQLETSFTLVANDTVGTRRSSTVKAWTYTYKFTGARQ